MNTRNHHDQTTVTTRIRTEDSYKIHRIVRGYSSNYSYFMSINRFLIFIRQTLNIIKLGGNIKMALLVDLSAEHEKDGLFDESDVGVSYPLGFPILDEQLGFIQEIDMPDGSKYTQYRRGVPAGSITIFAGPSSSGKTAAAIQAAYNIIEPFGEDAGMIIHDAENSLEDQRVMDLTGIDKYEMRQRVRILNKPEQNTFEGSLDILDKLCKKKESDKKRYMYNTGFKNVDGEDIIYYIPTVVVVDSLMKLVPEEINEELDKIQGLTVHGRNTIKRNWWLSSIVTLARKYNINFIVINHLANDFGMTQPGQSKGKSLTFMPTGKNMPGGEKVVYYMSTCILWVPINNKDGIKTEEENGYNGLPVKVSICKSRSGPGGKTAIMEFIQEAGYDPRLTLLNLAKSENLIGGRNPSSYFISHPDVKFDTRKFLDELREKPEVLQTLFEECKPKLHALLRKPADPDDFIRGANSKKTTRSLMKSLYD